MPKQKLMLYTDAQMIALDQIMRAKGDTYAELVRGLLADEAVRLGLVWPDDMPTKQETMRNAQKKRWSQKEQAS
jgi:hypothetical protein